MMHDPRTCTCSAPAVSYTRDPWEDYQKALNAVLPKFGCEPRDAALLRAGFDVASLLRVIGVLADRIKVLEDRAQPHRPPGHYHSAGTLLPPDDEQRLWEHGEPALTVGMD